MLVGLYLLYTINQPGEGWLGVRRDFAQILNRGPDAGLGFPPKVDHQLHLSTDDRVQKRITVGEMWTEDGVEFAEAGFIILRKGTYVSGCVVLKREGSQWVPSRGYDGLCRRLPIDEAVRNGN